MTLNTSALSRRGDELFRQSVEWLYDREKAFYGEENFVKCVISDPAERDFLLDDDLAAFDALNHSHKALSVMTCLYGTELFEAVVVVLQSQLDADGLQLQKRKRGFHVSFALKDA